MPELPEVETLCRQLRPEIVGAEIVATRVIDSKLGGIRGLKGRTVKGVTRYGKALEMELEGGGIACASLAHDRKTPVAQGEWHAPLA